jgi:hypothetical protein
LVLLALPLTVVSGAPAGVVDEDELDESGDLLVSVLIEEELPDGVVVVVVVELGVDMSLVELVLDEVLGVVVLGVTSVVELLVEGVVLALLLRSQPATAAEARASAATRGMSLFMTSPFRTGCSVGRSLTGPYGRCVQRSYTTHNACQQPCL